MIFQASLLTSSIKCPIVKEIWAIAEEQFVWGSPSDFKGLMEYSYQGKILRVIINPWHRRNRTRYPLNLKTREILIANFCCQYAGFRNVYINKKRDKRNIWRWKRQEDRKQKEMRLRNTWFLLPIDNEDDQGTYGNEDITFKGSSSRLYDKKRNRLKEDRWKEKEKRKRKEDWISQDCLRDEWRSHMYRPPGQTRLSSSEVKTIEMREKMMGKETVREEVLSLTSLTHSESGLVGGVAA
mgnify:CR=1 FL=1